MKPFLLHVPFGNEPVSSAPAPKAGPARGELLSGLKQGLLLGAAVAVLILPPSGLARLGMRAASHSSLFVSAPVAAPVVEEAMSSPGHADFANEMPSPDARAIADWVADSRDNHQLSFAILDKRGARVYVFDRNAKLVGSTMVLLGSATGDDTLPGVGDKPLSAMRPEERTTPAGRFVSEPGHDASGDDVVWVDYAAAVAMHRVKVIDPKERRFERIATASVDDKRISNGCINVPIDFFDSVVKPALGHSRAVVYVLPDVKPLREVFADSYAVDAGADR